MSIVTDKLTVGTAVTLGQIVHYVLGDDHKTPGEIRPAIVVRLFGNGVVNLQVFIDGLNDHTAYHKSAWQALNPLWVTSIDYDPDHKPGTWHFPGVTNDE